jgi:hypothetical protein
MTSIVTDFRSINRKLHRQEQKAEFDAKNPPPAKVVWTPEWGYGAPVTPFDWSAALDAWKVKI